MKSVTCDWRRWAFILAMFSGVLFVVLTAAAMVFYPGGTYTDHSTIGYSFWSNFFSDLGRTADFYGAPSTVSFSLFVTALTFAGLTLVLFFAAVPHLFLGTGPARRLAILGSVIGAISGLCFVGIAATPYDLFPDQHKVFVYAAFISFLPVVVLYFAAILLNKRYPRVYAFVYLAFALILAVYIGLMLGGPEVATEAGIKVQATGQKIVVYAQIVCMFIQAWGALRLKGLLDGAAVES